MPSEQFTDLLGFIGKLKQQVSELFILYLFQVDDRFFWNKYMIQDLTEIGVSSCFLKYSKIIIVKQIF